MREWNDDYGLNSGWSKSIYLALKTLNTECYDVFVGFVKNYVEV